MGDEMAESEGQVLIEGRWREAAGGEIIPVVNPSDGETFAEIARAGAEDVDAAVAAARRSLAGDWGRMPAFERGRILARLGQLILERVDDLAVLEARDVGKPLRQARADAIALARYFEFYGGAADKVHGQTIPYHAGYTVLTLREPHGVTGHIIPWNYPMQILGRSVGAALAMGNACVLKPGEDASLTALEVGRLAVDAGLPPGALNIVTGYGEEAGAALAAHPGIDHVSFTGSRAVGSLVQQAAAGHGCAVTLELGGKSPQVVFADADFDQALPFVVNAAIQNAGQTCSAGSRLLVEDAAYDAFVGLVAERFHTLDVGAAERDLDCGPLISRQQLERVEGFLAQAHKDRLLLLGEGKIAPNTPEGGFYVKPTLLGDVPPEHGLAQEEIFGPVLVAIRFKDEADAIRIANDTPYGLVAGVWTSDGGRQLRLARAIRAGQVFVNNYGAGGGVELPFGGMKGSGFGREKGFEALYGFSTLKTIALRHG
jgi:aldehyde dehydrogenase (NAD+)